MEKWSLGDRLVGLTKEEADVVAPWFSELADAHDLFVMNAPPAALDVWIDDTVERMLRQTDHCRVADLGGGSGHVALHAARHGSVVTLVDTSRRMLEIARGHIALHAPPGPITLIEDDVQHFLDQVDTRFDIIFAIGEVIDYLQYPEQFLRSCCARLAFNGALVLTFMNRHNLLPRLDPSALVTDDDRCLVWTERHGDGQRADLRAVAFNEFTIRAAIQCVGFRLIEMATPVGSARSGLIAYRRD